MKLSLRAGRQSIKPTRYLSLRAIALIPKYGKASWRIPAIPFNDQWNFQLSQHSLDYTWAPDIKNDTLELPIMKFRPEREEDKAKIGSYSSSQFADDHWETVKIEDQFDPAKGCRRYLSDWDAWWIGYYDYRMHIPNISGGKPLFSQIC